MGKKMAENLLWKLRNTNSREHHHVEEFHFHLGMEQQMTSGPPVQVFLKEWLGVSNYFHKWN